MNFRYLKDIHNFFKENFNQNLPQEEKYNYKSWEGKNVIWYGEPDQMIVIHKSQIFSMWGNIFYPEKIEHVTELILSSPQKVEFTCSHVIGGIVNIIDIEEEQQSFYNGKFYIDYHKEKPFSTGDKELDEYIGKEFYIEDNFREANNELINLMEKNKLAIVKDNKNINQLWNLFNNLEINKDQKEENREYFEEFLEIEKDIREAKENQEGDFGKFILQLRDGHHRVFGAIKTGENYICVNLSNNEEYEKYYQKYKV